MSDEQITRDEIGAGFTWRYDIPILTNPFMLWDMLRVLSLSVIIMWLLVALTGWIIEGEPVLLPLFVVAIAFGAVSVLFVLAGLLLGNRQGARFTVSGEGVGYAAEARERRVNRIVTIVGVLAGSPQTAGAGLLAQSQEQMLVPWSEIRQVRFYPRSRVISIRNSWRTVLRLNCAPEIFGRVSEEVNLHWQRIQQARTGLPADSLRVPPMLYFARAGMVIAYSIGANLWYWVDDELAGRIGILAALVLVGAVLADGPLRRILGFLALPGLGYHVYAIAVSALDPIEGLVERAYVYELDTPILAVAATCALALVFTALWCMFGRQRSEEVESPPADGM